MTRWEVATSDSSPFRTRCLSPVTSVGLISENLGTDDASNGTPANESENNHSTGAALGHPDRQQKDMIAARSL